MHKKVRISVLTWLTILTFTAGYTNALCIFYLKIPLTHYTGNLTNIAISLARHNMDGLNRIILAIFSFFVGCVIAGVLFYKKHVGFSKYFAIANIVYALFYISINMFIKNSIVLIVTTSFMAGLQNSLLTRYRGITTRTTHMTGYLTDAGVYLGRALRGDLYSFKIFLFFMINISTFVVGTFIGVYSFGIRGFEAFIIAGLFRIISSVFYLVFIYKKDKHQIILKNN